MSFQGTGLIDPQGPFRTRRSASMWFVSVALIIDALVALIAFFIFSSFYPAIIFSAALLALAALSIWRSRGWVYLLGGVSLVSWLGLNIPFILPDAIVHPVRDPLTFMGTLMVLNGVVGVAVGVLAFFQCRRGSWTPIGRTTSGEALFAATVGLMVGISYVGYVGGIAVEESGGAGVTNNIQSAPEGALVLLAQDNKFSGRTITGDAGLVTIYVVNKDEGLHTFDIAFGENRYSYPIAGKSTTAAIFEAGPGTYTFWCAIGDHRRIGMEGKLTIS